MAFAPALASAWELNAVAFATSDTVTMIGIGGSTDYVRIPQIAVRFVQDKAGCAMISFSADMVFFFQKFEVKAVMDNSIVCDSADSNIAFGTGRHSWLFFCPRLSPGAHIVSMQAKSTPDPKALIPSEMHQRTLVVHYYR